MGQLAKNNVPYSNPMQQSELLGEAKEKAQNVMDQTKDILQHELGARTQGAAGDLVDVANALRRTSKQLEGNSVAPYVEKAADQLERASSYVRTADPREIQRGVASFARREPLLFIGGAFALGMVAARFLKASGANAETSTTMEKKP
ncbi:MAG TPA: hypothetical protein VH054_03555 [Polyangiaceae bacterium]|jgi:hypothetical protein|nr:hypothetical protein [Polyangiaceae bacterium]